MKPEINNKRKTGTFTNTWKLNNTLLSNQWLKKKSQGKLENSLSQMKTKLHIPKLMGCSESSAKREIYSCKRIH